VQWLTFWIIMMIFFVVERLTDVLLSRLRFYYELKFVVILWLMYFQGCAAATPAGVSPTQLQICVSTARCLCG
jgi:hypothetical protein